MKGGVYDTAMLYFPTVWLAVALHAHEPHFTRPAHFARAEMPDPKLGCFHKGCSPIAT